jgi:hypothetical protein
MPQLLSSWELKRLIQEKEKSPELESLLNEYMNKWAIDSTGKAMSLSNLFYRRNLHYILDNINNEELLLGQLRKLFGGAYVD